MQSVFENNVKLFRL